MAQSASRNQQCFVQVESTYGTIPNSAGVASVANSNACRIISLTTNPRAGHIDRPDKTGTLSATVGVGGRKSAEWSARMSVAGSGTAGTVPNMDPFLQSAFGKAGTVASSTSVTYSLEDAAPSLSIYNFRSPSTVTQQCAFGAVVNSVRVPLNQDVAEIEFSGPARWVVDSTSFATHDTAGKGGLTAFPSAPSSPVYAGNMAVGFVGTVTLDGTTYSTIRSGNINIALSRELPMDVFNSYYAGQPTLGVREVTVDFNLYDADDAALTALKGKAISKTSVTLSFQIGATAGNIWTWTLNNVLLDVPSYDDGSANWSLNWTGRAYASSATAKDEVALVIT
jgi:hypothetical protein